LPDQLNTVNHRDKQIDALKGYAILLVVIGHVIAFSDSEAQLFVISKLIYSFHMQLFFFLGGYVIHGHIHPNVVVWIGKKIYQLSVPYVIFTIIFIFFLFEIIPSNFTLSNVLWALWSYSVPNSAWFLPVLLESILLLVIFIYLQKYINKYFFIIYFVIFCLIIPFTPLVKISAVHEITFYSPFVVMGYLFSRYRENISRYFNKIEISGFLIFIVLFVVKYFGLIPSVSNNLIYIFVLATGGIIFSWLLIRNLVKLKKTRKVLIFFGIFTMEIYLTHLLILCGFTFRHLPIWFGSGIAAAITGTIILLSLSLAASLALSYNKVVSLILFGRWPYKNVIKRSLGQSGNKLAEVGKSS
jgi:fucose 4-O-acetylase-like acetyltransferase